MTTLLQLDATPREGLQWGRGEVAECEIEAFAAASAASIGGVALAHIHGGGKNR